MKDLITLIAKALVDNPDQVNVTEVEGEKTTVLELRVAQTDLGKVIGKDGKQLARLTNNSAIEVSPAWSPDGRQIAFVSDRLGKPQVFIMKSRIVAMSFCEPRSW